MTNATLELGNPFPAASRTTTLPVDHTRLPEGLPIIVHSHLRWDFVWQRPQHILGRLAASHPIVFIEETQRSGGAPRLDISEPQRNVVRIIPAGGDGADDPDAQAMLLLQEIRRAFAEHPRLASLPSRVIHWFYTPMAAPCFLGKFDAAAVVYDCMDELSKFRFAPVDLPQRERLLLEAADVVFTGGHELFTAKSQHHRNVHFYGCGVEVEHYAKAMRPDTAVPSEVAALPAPVLGYFGVIDERLDYELIDKLALAFRHGSVVMIGPVAKVDAATLPRRANIHWLGQRPYDVLPHYVKAFHACLMPFALNEATQHINPTKTLEYMAAGKPVVSTAVKDVVRNFAPIAQVARSHAAFIRLAEDACRAPSAALIARGLERAANCSWDAIVAAMRGHVLSAVAAREARASQAAAVPARDAA